MNTITSFYKKGLKRGFTLIELLVVIAIIGLLSTIIAAPITQARKKGRDGKKVADLRQIVNALQQFADDNNGQYPGAIDDMVPKYLSNVPPNAKLDTLAKDKYMYVTYVDSGAIVNNSNGNIGFHLGSKLEATSLSLKDDRDCYMVGPVDLLNPTSTPYCIDIKNFTGSISSNNSNWGTNGFANNGTTTGATLTGSSTMTASSTFADFGGGDDDGVTNCDASINGPTSCIYDLTN